MPVGLVTGFTQTASKSGLTVTINGGTAVISGSVASFPIADITVPANILSYIYLNFISGLIEQSTSGFLAGAWPICTALTNSTRVTSLIDMRPDVFGGAASSSTSPAFALPVAVTSLNAYGDSITTGYQLPSFFGASWATIFSDMVGLSIANNYSVIGAVLDTNGYIPNACQNNPTAAVGSLIGGLSNHLSSVPSFTSQVISSLDQMVVWLALPNSAKVLATAMTQSGAWSTTSLFNLTAEFSTALNATLTGTANGTTVYFAYWTNAAYGTGDLTVDGSLVASINFATTYIPTGGGTFTPALIRVSGLAPGNHTIVIKNTTNAKVTNCLWIAGNQGTPQTPWVGVGASIQRTGLVSNGVTLNAAVAAEIANLVSDGLNVTFVDVSPALSVTAIPSQYQDGIHPNYYGATRLAGAWLAGLYPTTVYPASSGKNGDALAQILSNAGITPGSLVALYHMVVTSGAQAFANGTEANPSVSFGPVSTVLSGIWSNSAPVLGFSISALTQLLVATNIVRMPSTAALGFCSGGAGGTATDTAISRVSAGVMAVGNGTPGDFSATAKLGNVVATAAAPSVAASQIGYGATTATTATAGAQAAPPATVDGYIIVNIAGTNKKIPFYVI